MQLGVGLGLADILFRELNSEYTFFIKPLTTIPRPGTVSDCAYRIAIYISTELKLSIWPSASHRLMVVSKTNGASSVLCRVQ